MDNVLFKKYQSWFILKEFYGVIVFILLFNRKRILKSWKTKKSKDELPIILQLFPRNKLFLITNLDVLSNFDNIIKLYEIKFSSFKCCSKYFVQFIQT